MTYQQQDTVYESWTRQADLPMTTADLAPGQSMFVLIRDERGKFDRMTAKRLADDAMNDLILQGFDVFSVKEYDGQQEKKPCWHWMLEICRPDPFGV